MCDGLLLPNGEVNYDPESINGEYPVGTIASFTCDSGYNLNGSTSRTCQPSGNWTQRTPDCEQSKNILHLYKEFLIYIHSTYLK